jgi:hypothetical protein
MVMEMRQSSSKDIGVGTNINSGNIPLLEMDLDIVEDIPAELEDFIFLSRLGLFEDAHELFEQNLKPYLGFFPVLAEYADMLLEEGFYVELSKLLMNVSTFSGDEYQLLVLMRALSEAYIEGTSNKAKEQIDGTKPKLEVALELAQKWHDGCLKDTHSFSEVEVRGYLMFFGCILTLVVPNSRSLSFNHNSSSPQLPKPRRQILPTTTICKRIYDSMGRIPRVVHRLESPGQILGGPKDIYDSHTRALTGQG